MKTYDYFIILVFSVISNSCGHSQLNLDKINPVDSLRVNNMQDTTLKVDSNNNSSFYLVPEQFTPLIFIKAITSTRHPNFSINLTTILGDFPKNWVRRQHIDSLILLVNSKVKCNCLIRLESSLITRDSSDIGGYAILFINSFRHNKKVSCGLNTCAKTEIESVDEINKWWTKYNRTN